MVSRQSSQQSAEVIVAYGFDQMQLPLPEPVRRPTYQVEWVPYGSSDIPDAVGIIFPSGIFERVEYRRTILGDRDATVYCDRENFLALERYVVNVLRGGGWVAILAREIVDEFPSGRGYGTYRSDDSDLAKRLLNIFSVKRTPYSHGTGVVLPKRDEFARYIREWGIARTIFSVQDRARVLAKAGDDIVGFEYDSKFFVLPFHSNSASPERSTALAEQLACAVIDYRRKMLIELPAWVNDFQFFGEQKSRLEFADLQQRLLRLDAELKLWERRKIVLTSSGAVLKEALVEILGKFFALDVDPVDEGREDFKIIDGKTIVCIGEAKGTNAGIKREHINQVDSHRERLGLTDVVPGLLLINNQMDISEVTKRLETQVALDQVRHARRMNVLIMRTVDVLHLMRHLENQPRPREQFLSLIRSGGGWLTAGPLDYRIVTGDEPS